MDCYKSESEFIDSLDFLSPPVKRISSKDLFGCSYNGEPNNVQLFRGIRRKFAPKEKVAGHKQEKELNKATRTVKTGGESSTSLILKKTSERKILQRYTVVSYTSLHSSNLNITSPAKTCNRLETNNKPLIKVTVIPKSDQQQTAKLLRRRRSIPKRVQSTTSNQENSVRTKNLYLVVAGRRNKIYEIKTTGSATFSSDQTANNYGKNEISTEGLSNFKHLIQSLNMDQKQRHDRKELKIDGTERDTSPNNRNDPSSYVSKGIDPYEYEGYTCSGNLEGGKRPLNRSRVRIYGQLGLTDDDRYVLRYGATVNDKPVTDFTQLTQDFLPQVLPQSGYNPYEANPEVTKEVSVQATYGGHNRNQHSAVIYSKESQGTQVNFNISADTRHCCKALRVDKDIQCNCNNVVEPRVCENKSEFNALKESQSPLVIISVYPKQSPEEIVKYTSYAYRRPITQTNANAQYVPKFKVDTNDTNKRIIETKADERQNNKDTPIKKFNKRPPGNRSPSPLKNTPKGNLPENQTETIVLKTPTTTADRYKAMIKNKVIEKERKGRSEAPASSKVGVPISKPVQRSKSPLKKNLITRSQEKGTNTDHAKAKKNLVDNYTKQLTGQMNHRDVIPARLDNSKITINIDGEHEYYNVLFDSSKLSTNMRVNKTMKNINSQKSWPRATTPSLENLLILPEKKPDTQPQPVTRDKDEHNKQFDESSMNKRVSGMTIRDSLEISHRREDKHSSDVTSTRNCIPAHGIEDLSNNPECIAPNKHYTGDDCSICDPVERDKEIRILLGVDKSKFFAPKTLQAHSSENDEYHCFYRRECEKGQVAEINLVKYCPILGSLCKIRRKPCYCPDVARDYVGEEAAVQNKQEYGHEHNQSVTGNKESSAIYQQLILNRNIQIFLQVEQFSKQKPIILSRKQYDKVKKTIQTTLNQKCKCKEKRRPQDRDVSDISVGEVRQRRNKNIQLHFDQEIQTDWIWGKNSFQRPGKKPRMVSKVRYLVRAPRSKHFRGRLQDKDAARDECRIFEDIDGYYQFYPQNERNENLDPSQRTCQTIISGPKNYEYGRSREEYFETNQQKQYELPEGYRRNLELDRSNELKKNENDYYMPSVTVDKKRSKEYGKNYKSKENNCLQSGEKRKQNDNHCKQRKEYVKAHDIKRFENGEHQNGERRKSDGITLNNQKKECCIEIKEQRNSNTDKSFKDNTQHTLNEEYSKEFIEYDESIKNCIGSERLYIAEHQRANQEDRVVSDNCHKLSELRDMQNKEHAMVNRIHHRECEEYIVESDKYRPMSLQYPGDYSANAEHHSFHSHQNTKTHKINRVKDYPIIKREHYRPSKEHEDREIEHYKPVKERTEAFKRHGVLLPERLRYTAMHDKNMTVDIPCCEDLYIQKHDKNSEHELQESYSGLYGDLQGYCGPDVVADEYFRQSVEYCRLDVEHHRHKEEHENNDKCSVGTKGLTEGYDNQIDKDEQIRTVTLYDAHKHDSLQADHTDQSTKNTVSSLEIHYTSVAYSKKKKDLSSSDLAVLSDSSLCHVNSIQTIFRGRRKSPTPNLGTSIYSLCSENGLKSNKSAKFIMAPRDVKPSKRPFLRRLMSCLVMRSTRASDLKLPTPIAHEMPSVNSSVDSYHISTSLGAVEVSSSIYDTSASFYSNHTILPINSKIKRGFFNSVRGFLTNRRS